MAHGYGYAGHGGHDDRQYYQQQQPHAPQYPARGHQDYDRPRHEQHHQHTYSHYERDHDPRMRDRQDQRGGYRSDSREEHARWNEGHDDSIPPPREDNRLQYDDGARWQRDRYDAHQDYGYAHRDRPSRSDAYGDGLIRFPSPPPDIRHERNDYRDRPDEHDRRPRRRSPHEGPSTDYAERPRRQVRTAPNQSVILIGIPPMCDKEDVRSFIDEFKSDPSQPSPIEEVTVVMDKQTGESKRFGFVRFISLEHARAFIEANYDHVFWKSRGSHDIVEDGVKIRVDYASDDRRPGEARPRKREDNPNRDKRPIIMNDGSKDMGSTPNRVLLLRNLDPLTNETHLASKLETLDDAARQRTKAACGPAKIVLIKDRDSHASWCFAFAIFPDDESAKAAMRTILDPAAFPTGFTIQDKLVAVTFARTGCFTKAYATTTWSFTDELLDGKKHEYLYWDEGAYGLMYESPTYKIALDAKHEELAKSSDVDAFFSSLESETGKPKPGTDLVQPPPSINLSLAGSLGAPGQPAREKKRATELIISKKIAVDINKWNQKKAEDEPAAQASTSQAAVQTDTSASRAGASVAVAEAANDAASGIAKLNPEGLDFADLSSKTQPKCLLCQRQFKSLEILQKHSAQSELHKTNLADLEKVAAAREAVSQLPAGATAAGAASQYRDRALERRVALNQPDHPPPSSKRQKRGLETDQSKAATSAPEKHIEKTNIGSKLLAGMGWSTGSGLGTSTPGRLDPVQAKSFAVGAGIGASRGVSATDKANETWVGKDFGRMKAAQRMAESGK